MNEDNFPYVFFRCVLRFCRAFSRLKLTPPTVYNQVFLKPRVLQPVVLKKGPFKTRDSKNDGSSNQGFLQQKAEKKAVLSTRGSYIQGSYNQGL